MQKLSLKELNRISVDEFKSAEKAPIAVVLDNIRSLNNVGSVFRTSDAFRVEKIYLCGITAQPPHRDIQKTALGATESVDWEYFENTVDAVHKLRKEGYHISAIEQADKSIFLHDFEIEKGQKTALIFGNEVEGVSEEVMKIIDDCIEIPQFGTKHSFNISVSAGIVLWDIFRKVSTKLS